MTLANYEKPETDRVGLTPEIDYSNAAFVRPVCWKMLRHGKILRESCGAEENEQLSHLRVCVAYLRNELEMDPAEPELIFAEAGVSYRLTVTEYERD